MTKGKQGGSGLPEASAVVEALLFTAGRPVSFKELCRLAPEYDPAIIRLALDELGRRLSSGHDRGIELVEVAKGFRLQTVPDMARWVTRMRQAAPQRLSKASLEVLAIVAYRQPVTRAEVEHLRGVDSSGPLRFLLEKDLVRIAGRKEVPGRPILYGTTRRFLELFHLKDLSQLPPPEQGLDTEEVIHMEEGHHLPLFRDNGG